MLPLHELTEDRSSQVQGSTRDTESLLASDLEALSLRTDLPGEHVLILRQLWMINSQIKNDIDRLQELVVQAGLDAGRAYLVLSSLETMTSGIGIGNGETPTAP